MEADMKKAEVLVTKTVTRRCTVKVTGGDIIGWLKGVIPKGGQARVTFFVPRGGDYSGMQLDINEESPIYIEWEETTVEDSRG
jgi:hypothetical protein